MTNDFDVWLSLNRERLLDGNEVLIALGPYLDRSTDAEELRPLLVRLEGNTSEVTYSDFDQGALSSEFGRAGIRLREGLGAIDAGDAEGAGSSVSRGIGLYQHALGRAVRMVPDEPKVGRRFPWGFVLVLLLLMIWLL